MTSRQNRFFQNARALVWPAPLLGGSLLADKPEGMANGEARWGPGAKRWSESRPGVERTRLPAYPEVSRELTSVLHITIPPGVKLPMHIHPG